MGVEPQEARSLPRSRKCGNCRFYEPAPLWRKGWCRNQKLYPPHANHLVDATSIDCEGGFRSRIYWEPLPVAAPVEAHPPAANSPRTLRPQPPQEARSGPNPPIYNIQARSVEQPFGRVAPEVTPGEPPQEHTVVEAVVIEHPTAPSALVNTPRTGPDWRDKVREKAPFTQSWPLEKFNPALLPWLVFGFLSLIILFLLIGKIGKPGQDETSKVMAQATVNAQATINTQFTARVTTAVAVTPTPTQPPLKTALIKGNGASPLNVREEASLKGKLVTSLKEGEKVIILEGPKDADGRSWYKIETNGKTGWAVKDYIELQP